MDLFDLNPEIQKYSEDNTSPEDPVLQELRRYTFLKVTHPRMISGPVQGKFLEIISKLINPLRILEIGTFTGYSAICLAKGLQKKGKLITIEFNDELNSIQDRFFYMAGLKKRIVRINGDAIKVIPKLNEEFDLIFIDGNKDQYPEYYRLSFPLLKKGGLMLADNVLWDGKVVSDQFRKDETTKAIQKFNSLINSDLDNENVLLPFRDGLMLIRKL